MNATLPLDKMTVAEKLREIEALWADLSRDDQQIESPEWHSDVLRARMEVVKSGKETFVDWDTAKKQVRDRLARRS